MYVISNTCGYYIDQYGRWNNISEAIKFQTKESAERHNALNQFGGNINPLIN